MAIIKILDSSAKKVAIAILKKILSYIQIYSIRNVPKHNCTPRYLWFVSMELLK